MTDPSPLRRDAPPAAAGAPGRSRPSRVLSSRRLVAVAVVFGLFIVFDMALFGWLIFDSLSQREIDEVLLQTRAEAEPVAEEIEAHAERLGQEDLYVVVSVDQQTQDYIQSELSQREFVHWIEIRDREGKVVLQTRPVRDRVPRVETAPAPDGLEVANQPAGDVLPEIEVPIGDLGTIVIGLSARELAERAAVLRRDLIRQTSLIGALTLALLLAAFVAIWLLFQRSRRLEEQALEAERLAYVGTLASGLAHEIRNPLNSLSLNMQMLEEEVGSGGESSSRARLLALTRSELGRLERLATDFLTYARPRALDLDLVPAVDLLEQVLGVMGGEIQECGALVEIEDRSAGARVRVDRGQINQLLINLTQNALAATREVPRTPKIRLIARRDETGVVLEVEDNGQGIPAAERERIFELFYSTRKGGTGLGLAIAQRIAQAHDGELEVESVTGVGTTLRLRLPMAEPRAEPAREHEVGTLVEGEA